MSDLKNDPAIIKLLKYAKEKKSITYDEVSDLLPENIVNTDKMDEVLAILASNKIKIEEDINLQFEDDKDEDQKDDKKKKDAENKAIETITRQQKTEGIVEKLDKIFEHRYWKDVAAKCVGCGTCTYLCPTCHCFDIQDESTLTKGARIRVWDNCMNPEYTLHASGFKQDLLGQIE